MELCPLVETYLPRNEPESWRLGEKSCEWVIRCNSERWEVVTPSFTSWLPDLCVLTMGETKAYNMLCLLIQIYASLLWDRTQFFIVLFPSWHHDWKGHFFFQPSQLLLGDGVLAEMSEFHGPKHLTTPLVLSISSLIKYSVILITNVIRRFSSLFFGSGRSLRAGRASPFPGYVTIPVRRVDCSFHKPTCC